MTLRITVAALVVTLSVGCTSTLPAPYAGPVADKVINVEGESAADMYESFSTVDG